MFTSMGWWVWNFNTSCFRPKLRNVGEFKFKICIQIHHIHHQRNETNHLKYFRFLFYSSGHYLNIMNQFQWCDLYKIIASVTVGKKILLKRSNKNKKLKFSNEVSRKLNLAELAQWILSLLQKSQMARKFQITGNELWTVVWHLI